ncbi:MAG: 50S ribosomal protein L23 [Planctomycetota bacterium]
MKTPYDIIVKPLVTEKVMKETEKGRTYTFEVNLQSNKPEIKKAIENIFSVKIDDIRTITMKGKPKRYRTKIGYTSDWKKAMVTLKEGQRIDII